MLVFIKLENCASLSCIQTNSKAGSVICRADILLKRRVCTCDTIHRFCRLAVSF